MKKRQILLSMLLTMALIIGSVPVFTVSAAADTVTIYHTNDMHGGIEASFNEDTNEIEKPGLDYVAALHAANPNSLLVDAGDFSQGALFANMAHGLSVVEVMNAAGYDVAALGNHEFDYSVAELESNVGAAEFDVISANVTIDPSFASQNPNLAAMPRYVVKEAGGRRIAFFSCDTPELNGMVNPATLNAGGVKVRTDISALAAEIVAEIKKDVPDVDAIIAVTHCGYAENSAGETSRDVAMVDGVDAVIDGHDHQLRLGDSAVDVKGTLVVSTGTGLTSLGCLTLDWSSGSLKITSSDAREQAMSMEPVAAVTAVIDRWNAEFDEIRNEVVFYSETNIWGGNIAGLAADGSDITASIARRGETNGGDLIGDARLWKAKNWLAENWSSDAYAELGLTADMPVVALSCGGGVRNSFRAGDVTLGGLMTAYSFSFEDAEDTYVLITPKVMYDMIEHGVNIFISQDPETGFLEADGSIHGRFPQAIGFTYSYDLTQPASGEYDKDKLTMPTVIGSRVQSITLDDGTVLDRNDNETGIMLVTGSYEIGGGDSYWMLGALNNAPDFGGYQFIPEIATPAGNSGDAVIDYVNEVYGGRLPASAYPLASGRIERVNDPYTGSGFTSTVTLTNGGAALADTALAAFVNGERTDVTTDADGVLTLELPNGPSEVRFVSADGSYDTGSYYLDNYCGLVNVVADNAPGEPLPEGIGAPQDGEEQPPAESEPEPEEPALSSAEVVVRVVIGALIAAAVFAMVIVKSKNDRKNKSKK